MKNAESKTQNSPGKPARRKPGVYLTVIIVGVAAAVVAVNALAGALDESVGLRADITDEQYTTLTDASIDVLDSLDQDVYLYYIGTSEQDDLYMTGLLKNYARASKRVSYRLVDPGAHPGFTQQYDPDGTGIADMSVIVSDVDGFSGDAPERYKVISPDDQYESSEAYYDNSGNLVSDYKYFKGEQKVTSAIDYIMTGETMTAVFLAGHGESAPCASLLRDIGALNYATGQYDFNAAQTSISPSTDTLIVISPKTDLSDEEYTDIKAFLKAGGKAIFLLDSMSVDWATGQKEFVAEDRGNFDSLLMLYGVSVNDDVILESDPSRTYKNQANIIPAPVGSEPISLSLAESCQNPVLSYASSINIPETTAADLSVSPLLQAGETCYAKSLGNGLDTLDREADDKSGPFTVGAMMRMDDSAVVLYTSASFVASEEYYGYQGNARLFLETLNDLNQKMDSVSIPMRTIESASDTAYKLGYTPDIQKLLYVILVAAMVPLAVLAVGLARWLKRRRL